jgi:[ribosomal protein S5]-alanine N-acetyltransferase
MPIQNHFTTSRLVIQPLTVNDNIFILELVNTDGWIKFIGNRHINSAADATAYIERIISNKNITYWTVQLRNTTTLIGIITFIKRDYLPHHDIGFAFLPNFCNSGYAYEAAHTVLNELLQNNNFTHILATTIPENISSVKLLKKLGLQFDKAIKVDEESLHVYAAAAEKITPLHNSTTAE